METKTPTRCSQCRKENASLTEVRFYPTTEDLPALVLYLCPECFEQYKESFAPLLKLIAGLFALIVIGVVVIALCLMGHNEQGGILNNLIDK